MFMFNWLWSSNYSEQPQTYIKYEPFVNSQGSELAQDRLTTVGINVINKILLKTDKLNYMSMLSTLINPISNLHRDITSRQFDDEFYPKFTEVYEKALDLIYAVLNRALEGFSETAEDFQDNSDDVVVILSDPIKDAKFAFMDSAKDFLDFCNKGEEYIFPIAFVDLLNNFFSSQAFQEIIQTPPNAPEETVSYSDEEAPAVQA